MKANVGSVLAQFSLTLFYAHWPSFLWTFLRPPFLILFLCIKFSSNKHHYSSLIYAHLLAKKRLSPRATHQFVWFDTVVELIIDCQATFFSFSWRSGYPSSNWQFSLAVPCLIVYARTPLWKPNQLFLSSEAVMSIVWFNLFFTHVQAVLQLLSFSLVAAPWDTDVFGLISVHCQNPFGTARNQYDARALEHPT